MGACYPKRKSKDTLEAKAEDLPRGNQVGNSPQNSVVSNNGVKVSQRQEANGVMPEDAVAQDGLLESGRQAGQPRGDLLAGRDSQRSLQQAQPPLQQRAAWDLDVPEELGEGEVIRLRHAHHQPKAMDRQNSQSRPALPPIQASRSPFRVQASPDHSIDREFTQPTQQPLRPPAPAAPEEASPGDALESDPDQQHFLPEPRERPSAALRPAVAGEVKDEVITPWKVAGAELSDGEKHLFFADSLNFRTKNHQYLGCEFLLKKTPGLSLEDVWRQGRLKANEDLLRDQQAAAAGNKGGLLGQLFGFGSDPQRDLDAQSDHQPPREDPTKLKPVVSVTLSVSRDKLAEAMERLPRFRSELEKAVEGCSVLLQVNPDAHACELYLNEERVATFSDPNHLLKPNTVADLAKKAKKK